MSSPASWQLAVLRFGNIFPWRCGKSSAFRAGSFGVVGCSCSALALATSHRSSASCRTRLTFRSRRTASPPLNSSVRLHKRFRVIARSAPASRSRFASASFLRCASSRPACVACRRFVGFRNVRAVFVRASILFSAGAVRRNVTTSSAVRLSCAGPHQLAFLQCVWCGTIVHQRSGLGAA